MQMNDKYFTLMILAINFIWLKYFKSNLKTMIIYCKIQIKKTQDQKKLS